MRTIKASEVVKGMRVRVERTSANVNTTIEGEVCQVFPSGTAVRYVFENGDTWILALDHPVTVLAEPEPEWVEGAWYRCQVNMTGDGVKLMRRGVGGWTSFEAGPWTYQDAAVTVLGRVLIVDWPGGDVARNILNADDSGYTDLFTEKVTDAIRTQGGVR